MGGHGMRCRHHGRTLRTFSLSNGRLIPEAAAFIPWLALLSVLVLIIAALTRRKVLSAVTVLCLVCQIVWHVGFFLPAPRIAEEAVEAVPEQTTPRDTVMRVMTLNTKNGNADAEQIVSIVRDQHVEVLAMQEVSGSLIERLSAAGLDELLPSRVIGLAGAGDNGGVTSSTRSRPCATLRKASCPSPDLRAGLHDNRRIPRGAPRQRASHIAQDGHARLLEREPHQLGNLAPIQHEYLIMGDFNSTWDHSRYRKMLGDTLVDASEQAGEGFHMTYPSEPHYAMVPVPPMIEIDHIVYSKNSGMSVGDLETVNVQGSDHFALLGTWVIE